MASSGIPEPDVFEIPAKRPRNSPQAASWRSDRMANTGPQMPPGWAPPEGVGGMPADKTMRWAQSVQQGAAKFAEGPGPNGITEGARNFASKIRDGSAAVTRVGMDVAKGTAKRIPLGGVVGVGSEILPHSGAYTGASDMPLGDRMRVGATDLMAFGGGSLGGMVGAGVGQLALPIPGVGAVAGGLAGGYYGAWKGRQFGNKLFDSDGALQRAGFDPNRGLTDIAGDVASGKSLDEAMAPTMRAPVMPQRPAAPGLSGIGAVRDAQTPAPTSFADGAGGGFAQRPESIRNGGFGVPFAPNQVTPTGPNLVGRAPTTFAEGSDRGGTTIGPNAVPTAVPTAGPQNAASFRANPDGQPGGTIPGTGVPMPPNPAGTIRRVGNSYEGTNIKFGADINNPRNPGVGVTSFDTSEGRRQDAMELQRMRDARSAPSITTGDGGSTLGQGPIGIGGGGGSGELRGKRADRAAQLIEASMRERTARETSAAQVAAQMYGHDIAAQGHVLTNQSNRMRLQAEQFNKDRDHDANRSDAAFTQGQQAIKDLHQEVAGMIPPTTDRDGKSVPDTENAARYATALQTSVGRLGGSMKDLDAKDKARFVAGMQLADVASATATGGFTPWGTRAVQSNEPILALRKLPNGDYQTNRKGVNGETEVIPGRYIEKEGSVMGMGGRASNKFKSLME